MSPAPLAITWAAGGLIAALLMGRVHRRRFAVLVPLAASVVAALTIGADADVAPTLAAGGFDLGRPAGGLALLCALAVTVSLLVSPPVAAGDILVVGGCGALSVLALAAGSPIAWAVCLVGGGGLVGMRWLTAAPSRATLAAARVATLSGAALLAAAPFLPVDTTSPAPRLHVVGGLLGAGLAAGFGLVPFGGWITGGSRELRVAAVLPWVLLLLPALVLSTQSLEATLPAESRAILGWVVLPLGALTAAWSAVNGLIVRDRERYLRVLVADIALVALALTSHDNGARVGSLLLLLTHVVVAPLALQEPSAALSRQRRLAWLALSGIPPSPAFWGRFALATAMAGSFGAPPLLVIIPTMGLLLGVALRAIAAAPGAGQPDAAPVPSRVARLAAWVPPLAVLTVGLVPDAALRALLGLG